MGTTARRVSRRVAGTGLLSSLALFHATAFAGECADFTSATATPAGELRLCEQAVSRGTRTYACRDYRDSGHRYVLLFEGGPWPKAVVRQESHGGDATVRPVRRADAVRLTCHQGPPHGVPETATYRGTGVCLDADDRSVPCSVFEHAAARDPQLMRYMVFYDPEGRGPVAIDASVAGENVDALPAELAYRLGVALLDTGCCQGQGTEYLELAHRLHPDDPAYRSAYRNSVAEHCSGPAGSDRVSTRHRTAR